MSRIRRVVLVALVCAGVGFLGARAAQAAGGFSTDPGEELIWRLPLEQKLEKSISFSFEDMPLTDVVEFFRSQLQANIVLDRTAIAEDEKLIKLTGNDMRAGDALQWVMTLAGLEYSFQNGAIFISTPEKARAGETKYFLVYDVRDLVQSAAATGGGGTTGASTGSGAVPTSWSGRTGSSSGGNQTSGSQQGTTRGQSGSASLMYLILELTGRENWKSASIVGGSTNQDESSRGAGTF